MARKKKPTVLNEEEQEILLEQPNTNAPTGFRNYVMMKMMLNLGMRIGEVTTLELKHIDNYRNQVDIKNSKGAKDRVLWIDEDTLSDLNKWIEWRGDLIEDGRIPEPSKVDEDDRNLVFVTFNGTPVKHSYMRRTVKKYAREGNISKWESVNNHMLRHTFATDLLNKTNNLRKVQRVLGHESSDTTEIYTHLADEDLKNDMMNLRKGGV